MKLIEQHLRRRGFAVMRLSASVILAAIVPFVFQACLTANSSAGERSTDYVALGGDHYRAGRFDEAMAAYDTALIQDSSRSLAYYGYARAALARHGVVQTALYADVRAMSNGSLSTFAFLDHPDSVLTHRLVGGGAALRMLQRLVDRDTLTRWWSYMEGTVTAQEAADTLYHARRAFMATYFAKAQSGDSGYRPRDRFPLSDLRIGRAAVLVDLTVLDLMYTVTRLYDFDRNDTVDARDSLMKKLKFGSGGGIDSLGNLAGLEDDSAAPSGMNAIITDMQSGLLDISELTHLINPPGSGGGDTAADLDSAIGNLAGGTLSFYQFGDGLDNDGDGCVDEEILDEKDNDLDGFVDEDARVVRSDLRDNDRNGSADEPGEDTVGVAADSQAPHVLGFVHAFFAVNPDSLFVKIRKGAADMALRIAIQKDSLATKSPADLAGPLKAKLDSAKALVGGCWRNHP